MSGIRFRSDTAEETAVVCAQVIADDIRAAVATRGKATLAISGGSAIKLLFPRLVAAGLPWKNVQLFWVDERGVSPTDEQSNYRLAKELLIGPADIPSANIHRIQGELDPQVAAARYVDEIREVFSLGPDVLPEFDVIHHGMGPDGHTASLFPGEPLIEDRTGIAAAIYVPKMSQWRITLLPGVLLIPAHTVFFVTGAEKADAAKAVFDGPDQPLEFPSQMVERGGRRVSWFLDQAAARLLD
jgi:6-phosphogluconolactonase